MEALKKYNKLLFHSLLQLSEAISQSLMDTGEMDFTFGGDVSKVAEKRVYPKLSENDLAGLFAAQKGVS